MMTPKIHDHDDLRRSQGLDETSPPKDDTGSPKFASITTPMRPPAAKRISFDDETTTPGTEASDTPSSVFSELPSVATPMSEVSDRGSGSLSPVQSQTRLQNDRDQSNNNSLLTLPKRNYRRRSKVSPRSSQSPPGSPTPQPRRKLFDVDQQGKPDINKISTQRTEAKSPSTSSREERSKKEKVEIEDAKINHQATGDVATGSSDTATEQAANTKSLVQEIESLIPAGLVPPGVRQDGDKKAVLYKPRPLVPNHLQRFIEKMRKQPGPINLRRGYVYGYTDKSVSGLLKIGTVSIPENFSTFPSTTSVVLETSTGDINCVKKEHYRLWQRLREQKRACFSDMILQFAVYVPHAAGQMERLTHGVLQTLGRQMVCPACRHEHREWYEVTTDKALSTVQSWGSFSEMEPYNLENGNLGPSWTAFLIETHKKKLKIPVDTWFLGQWADFVGQQAKRLAEVAIDTERVEEVDRMGNIIKAIEELQLENLQIRQEKNELKQKLLLRELDQIREQHDRQ
ncbi:hypothetical protein V2G26_010891 [Clonostachys chloroleuca]